MASAALEQSRRKARNSALETDPRIPPETPPTYRGPAKNQLCNTRGSNPLTLASSIFALPTHLLLEVSAEFLPGEVLVIVEVDLLEHVDGDRTLLGAEKLDVEMQDSAA